MCTVDNNMGSDSDSNPDDTPEYYQPISAVDVDGDGDEDSDRANSDEEHLSYHAHLTQNGFSSLHLDGDSEGKSSGDDDEDEDEDYEERPREASDSAISRAFREDESRRNAPLTAENAMRVMEAMRGVSFRGLAPDWAGRIPEEQWIDRVRRLQQPRRPASASAVQD
uniref:Uncharacterized protein MANES_18G142700 n=1 Tax=Rhizophora mucronata TaxID=61149 RepID=A0A2P2IMY3_RHIMU